MHESVFYWLEDSGATLCQYFSVSTILAGRSWLCYKVSGIFVDESWWIYFDKRHSLNVSSLKMWDTSTKLEFFLLKLQWMKIKRYSKYHFCSYLSTVNCKGFFDDLIIYHIPSQGLGKVAMIMAGKLIFKTLKFSFFPPTVNNIKNDDLHVGSVVSIWNEFMESFFCNCFNVGKPPEYFRNYRIIMGPKISWLTKCIVCTTKFLPNPCLTKTGLATQ